MRKTILCLTISLGLWASEGVCAQTSSSSGNGANSPIYKVLGIKTPCKSLTQWSVEDWVVSDLSPYNLTKSSEYQRALENGDIDEMSDTMFGYQFVNGKVKDFPELKAEDIMDYSTSALVPCDYVIEYKDGLPTTYKFVSESSDVVGLDAFDGCWEDFKITYNAQGLPIKIVGKTCEGFFSGMDFVLNIIDYEFDDKGNWVRRKIWRNGDDSLMLQFREYKY